MKKVRRGAAERERLLAEFRSSGLNQAQFAERSGVPQGTLSGWIVAEQRGSRRKAGVGKGRAGRKSGPYTPEQRIQAVQAYLKSGMGLKDFGKVWGVSGASTLQKWVQIYEAEGPKALERGIYGKGEKRRGRKRLPEPVRQEIIQNKIEHPNHGIKSVRNFLWRFRGVKVSTGSVRKTLKEADLPPPPKRRKKPKRHKKVRRFERARPMQLWQSDITSYVLTRHSVRIYLTVFLDDYSRFIVGWNLAPRQTTDFVVEALQSGISRFGKPEEILTDQGRQYYSWRGRSEFQKLLAKEGIEHIKSRTHHPQTLGKCERLWETVGEEFWDRAKPQDLADARERFKHFVEHYNHFRPHQGIDGMTPADRFFGQESEVRKAIEATVASNALRLALGEAPRTPVFLVGQIGDQQLSMHGEGGRLMVQMPGGLKKALEYREFGHSKQTEGEKHDERSHDPREAGGRGNRETQAPRGPAEGVQDAATGNPGEGIVGGGEAGGAREGACAGSIDHGILDGSDEQGRGGEASEPAHAPGVAVIPAGDLGYGGGIAAPTEGAPEGRARVEQGRGSEASEEADRGAGADGGDAGSADRGLTRDAGLPGRDDPDGTSDGSGEEECERKRLEREEKERSGTGGSSR
ncbi:MAG: IS3 family transposase [Bdellovibrionales bacterium]|nr:IS3 family transposase [Bdellovibrionales bacterium]